MKYTANVIGKPRHRISCKQYGIQYTWETNCEFFLLPLWIYGHTLSLIWNVCMSVLKIWAFICPLFNMRFSLSAVNFRHSVLSNFLRTHGLPHARPPCPSSTSRFHSCPLSQRFCPTISSSVAPFSSCLQCFPALGTFPMNLFFRQVAKLVYFQLQPESFQTIVRTDFL